MRFLLWITEPSMIKGMAMGIVLALVVSVAFRLESMWFVASSVLTLVVMCLFGVLIGNYVFESRRKRMQRQGLALVRQAGGELPGLSDDLMYLLVNRDRNHLPVLWQRLGRIQPAIEELIGLTLAAVFRVMAMSTLFAVLGGAISFAVFLASYMQVERMEAQNKLIGEQIRQADEQMRFAKEQQQIEVALRGEHTHRCIIGIADVVWFIPDLKSNDAGRARIAGCHFSNPSPHKRGAGISTVPVIWIFHPAWEPRYHHNGTTSPWN